MFDDPRVFTELCGNRQKINAEKTEDTRKAREKGTQLIYYFGAAALILMLSLIIWRLVHMKQILDDEEDRAYDMGLLRAGEA